MNGCDDAQALIPGLPDDLALNCLARVPLRSLPSLRRVARRWRLLLSSPSFPFLRRTLAADEHLFLLIQSHPPPPAAEGDAKPPFRPPSCSLVAYNASTGVWMRAERTVPAFARVAAVEGRAVVVGGWDPETLKPLPDVWILDPFKGYWRKGKPMPAARSFFACAAIGNRVFVAGGHDPQKNALRTAMAYDVAADEWEALPEMEEERDECVGVTAGCRIWVVGGYRTEEQGQFRDDGEWYDPDAKRWIRSEGIGGGASGAAVFGEARKLRRVDRTGVREYGRREWKTTGKGPEGMRFPATAAAAEEAERVLVMGTEEGNRAAGWILEKGKWIRVQMPDEFCGCVYSAAAIRV